MRTLLVALCCLVSAPAIAQGIYLADGTGGGIYYAKATTRVASPFGTFESEASAVGVSVESVSGRGQVRAGLSYSSPGEGVSVFGLSSQFGFLVARQHRPGTRAGATLALNGGLGGVFVSAEGSRPQSTQFLTLGPEVGIALPLGPSADLVPSGAFVVTVPIGTEGAETSVGFGGALGLSIASGTGFRLVLEPGLARSGDTTTFSFSLKMFKER